MTDDFDILVGARLLQSLFGQVLRFVQAADAGIGLGGNGHQVGAFTGLQQFVGQWKIIFHQLERSGGASSRATPVGGCVLRDLEFTVVPAGSGESPHVTLLEIKATGLDGPGRLVEQTLSELVPLPYMVTTGAYTLDREEQ